MRFLLLFLMLSFSSSGIYGQSFEFSNTAFNIGDKLIIDVWYDFSKANIRTESDSLLDSCARFLIKHPNLVIEISNHRDSRGSNASSSRLTQRRAESVRTALISREVPINQIYAKGYGESQVIISDDIINKLEKAEEQEAAHKLNRRTELKILNIVEH